MENSARMPRDSTDEVIEGGKEGPETSSIHEPIDPATHSYTQFLSTVTNYMKVDTLLDDQFLYCEECNKQYERDCPVHGPLLIVEDTKRGIGASVCTTEESAEVGEEGTDRALQTLPPGLCVQESSIPNAGLGVWTDHEIPARTRFGPYEGEKIEDLDKANTTGYAWQILENGKPSYFINDNEKNKSNWMRYVNFARNKNEQNLTAYQHKGQIYYRSYQVINAQTELLVWYGDELGINRGEDPMDMKLLAVGGEVEKPYKCDVCGKGFSQTQRLQIHYRTHTGEKPYKCDVCGKDFSQSGDLQRHFRTHTGDKPYQCDVCGKEYSEPSGLWYHIRTHTGEKPYQCGECGKEFSQAGDLQRHLRTHTGEKPYKCEFCDKRFSQTPHLQRHIRTHTGEKPYKCHICNKGFSLDHNLQSHIRTHTGEKPFHCKVCGKGFSWPGYLQSHLRTHTGEKPHTCNVCGKGFSVAQNMQRHLRTHTGEKTCKCDICGKGFSQAGDLQKHHRTHTKEKPYKCGVCGKEFSWTYSLRLHLGTHTKDQPHKCDVCCKGFSRADNLQKHLRTHTGENTTQV